MTAAAPRALSAWRSSDARFFSTAGRLRAQATIVQIACRFARQLARIETTLFLAACPEQNDAQCSSRSLRFGSMSPRLYARET